MGRVQKKVVALCYDPCQNIQLSVYYYHSPFSLAVTGCNLYWLEELHMFLFSCMSEHTYMQQSSPSGAVVRVFCFFWGGPCYSDWNTTAYISFTSLHDYSKHFIWNWTLDSNVMTIALDEMDNCRAFEESQTYLLHCSISLNLSGVLSNSNVFQMYYHCNRTVVNSYLCSLCSVKIYISSIRQSTLKQNGLHMMNIDHLSNKAA